MLARLGDVAEKGREEERERKRDRNLKRDLETFEKTLTLTKSLNYRIRISTKLDNKSREICGDRNINNER